MRRTMIACLALAWTAPAQTGSSCARHVRRPAGAGHVNDKLELTILTTGGSSGQPGAERRPGKAQSVLESGAHGARGRRERAYGPAMGHFVCVDGFGPVSAEEAAGLPGHGEAHTVPWEVTFSGKLASIATLAFTAELPIVQETFTRTFRMVDGENIIHVQSELESHLGFDRPVNWAEHATIGSPFLAPENTVLDLSGKHGKTLKHPPSRRCRCAWHRFRTSNGPWRRNSGRRSICGRSPPVRIRSINDGPDGPVAPAGMGDGDQYGQADDPRLRVQARGVSVAAGLGEFIRPI